MPQKLEHQHRPSSESVTEPESETEPEFQPEQTKATTASKVNYSKFYPGEFKPTTHISPALQPVKLLSNVPLVNSSHAKRSTLKREASSSPKVRDDDKENIHPGPPPLKQCRLDNPDPPSSLNFADGNSYRDILKCIIPCLTDILPSNSPDIHCFRLLGILRAIAGLHPVSEEHIKYFEGCLPKYEELCTRLSNEYNKNYNYPKHHFLMHLPWDLRSKASTDNYTTRPGEGFQQEVQQAYDQTIFRNTEPQMVRIGENQEAIARITMAVEHYDRSKEALIEEEIENDGEEAPIPVIEGDHWKLGSPLRRISAREWETVEAGHPAFRRFEARLIEFLDQFLPADDRPTQPILLKHYQCIHIRYRSLENWQENQDILRCNPKFYGECRYDCVVINTEPISFGHIYGLFTCETPSKTRHDIALIGKFEATKWKPKTRWVSKLK
ncbi:hypothetical protein M422DRAFT_264356 [Sphaerobolus stellatus SS14]|uniref:Uncharacterized protein n=1 Tax=Sphaerobolus stellatus (strain SS14) TaxID=990650 RepID=A0A0C9UFM7_SPHS4|nr:hypothetical protein M422DRAFT_264356 [Sphaerobolus stellatus SS14]